VSILVLLAPRSIFGNSHSPLPRCVDTVLGCFGGSRSLESLALFILTNQSQHVNKDVDDVIVESHGAKDIVRLVHLVFSVLASNDQPSVVRQIEREETSAKETVNHIVVW
jgi:Icc-related predicted phosphoesterase